MCCAKTRCPIYRINISSVKSMSDTVHARAGGTGFTTIEVGVNTAVDKYVELKGYFLRDGRCNFASVQAAG